MGYLTRNLNWSSGHVLSSGAGVSDIIDIGDHVALGLIVQSSGAIAPTLHFNVGISTAALFPLFDSSNAEITLTISSVTKQAYDLHPALGVWKYVQLASTAGSTTMAFTVIRKG